MWSDQGEAHRVEQMRYDCPRCFNPEWLARFKTHDDGSLIYPNPKCQTCDGTGVAKSKPPREVGG